jgi:hypothetical protein
MAIRLGGYHTSKICPNRIIPYRIDLRPLSTRKIGKADASENLIWCQDLHQSRLCCSEGKQLHRTAVLLGLVFLPPCSTIMVPDSIDRGGRSCATCQISQGQQHLHAQAARHQYHCVHQATANFGGMSWGYKPHFALVVDNGFTRSFSKRETRGQTAIRPKEDSRRAKSHSAGTQHSSSDKHSGDGWL